MDATVEVARQQWEEGYRALAPDPGSGDIDERVLEQIEVVTLELRRRMGGSFSLAELAWLYDGSSRWTHEAIAERCGRPGWVRSATSAADAAFHLFSRGARDYRP